mmetsp:Transcript_33538/g.44233  ORF Transcript_33538/g.44233 Transcript_33538/m.44233 type:complete len:95 (+) Transcript_33538:9-293(+)
MDKDLFPYAAALATITVLEAITGFSKANANVLRSFMSHSFLILMLAQSFWAAKLAKKERDEKFNYGYVRLNIMAAFANTVFLMSKSLFGFLDCF